MRPKDSLEGCLYVAVHGPIYDDVDAGTEIHEAHTHKDEHVHLIRRGSGGGGRGGAQEHYLK